MRKFTLFVLKKFLPGTIDSFTQDQRSRIGYLEGWASIFINLLIFIIKLILGLITSSIALIADAFHSLGDTSTSIIIIISFKISKKPSDLEHPFGHQRAEAISTIIIATLLFITGLELGRSAFDRILHPSAFTSNWFIIGIIFLTIVIKELLAQFAKELGRIINSSSLQADFWHHRSDVLATFLVLIAFILGNFRIHSIDGYAGVAVALLIMYTGFDVAKSAVNHLLGSAPDPEYLQKVMTIASSFPEVDNVHDIIFHQYGENKILSLHIEIPSALSLEKAHAIAEEVEYRIFTELKTHATVHFEPINTEDPKISKVSKIIQKQIEKDPRMQSYHALRTDGDQPSHVVSFDLVVTKDTPREEIEAIRKSLSELVKASSKNIKQVIIKIEPSYSLQNNIN